jgi:hypothetical protein
MEAFLATQHTADANLQSTLNVALDAWSIGHLILEIGDVSEQPEPSAVTKHRQDQLAIGGIEAALLERDAGTAIRYRSLSDKELRPLLRD